MATTHRHALTTLAISATAACLSLLPTACMLSTVFPPKVVDITAPDGLVLKGTLFAPQSLSSGPAVLLLHQCDDRRTVWEPLGLRLAERGITALAIDYRGYGESGGTPHDQMANDALTTMMTTVWPSDIDAALAFLSKQAGVDASRVGAAGGSCGVNNAVQLARRHDNVKALALLAGPLDRAGRLFLEGAAAPPLFVAAAADDQYANFVQIGSWQFGVSKRPESRFAQYPTGGHAAVVFKTHPELADAIAKWFAAVLVGGPNALPSTNGEPLAANTLEALHAIDQPGGAAAAIARYSSDGSSRGPRLPEYFVNLLGYEHVVLKDYATAVDLMKLNTLLYPTSPNTFDSLGDVYLAAGDRRSALEATKQTLALLDKDTVDTPQRKTAIRTSAEAKIAQLSPK